MEVIGPKIAEGRDSEIYDHGVGKVLRLARDGRSLVPEAEIMRYVRSHDYPVPEVFDAGQGYLVMERVDGPTMLERAIPLQIGRSARLLAELHDRLHRIRAPAGLRVAPLPGDRLVHCDLHPLNVIMTDRGPVVIDWANASAGDPAFDVADTWILLACADPPASRVERTLAPIVRKILVRNFLLGLDREAARRAIPVTVVHRLSDRNMSPAECDRMRALARWAAT